MSGDVRRMKECEFVMEIKAEDGDDDAFVAIVSAIIRGIAARHAPREFNVVKIDNWFGSNWLYFSGKVLGSLGVWDETLRVPPFVPNRVRWQRRFLAPTYTDAPVVSPLHVSTSSEMAIRRSVTRVAPGAALIWFSGKSAANARGAIMAYVPTEKSYWIWYTGWARRETWRPVELRQISPDKIAELACLEDANPL